ncbi:nitrate ABC transporter ATP-binding protein [Alkalihalophilus pseudofirmus]|uniref:ABC transporter ATP-binding protein n=1 Tax=Alkalihalophilus pseudofirmus TaxID=79885 RepID=UPI00095189E3|nr:nitrate ABC transporter ATP-binding protein [Alkalihalophilus pseudofirmus]
MSAKLLELRDITFTYKTAQRPTIERLNAEVYEGEFLSLIAPSGAGKSTIFRLLMGLEQPQHGEALFHNNSSAMGYMPQKDLLLEWRTVLENVTLPLELKGVNKKEAKTIAEPYFVQFGLEGTQHQYPRELSGGMRQRASFLRAMIGGSKLLLLDEPFSALDAMTRLHMQDWLKKVCSDLNLTVILITHDMDEALRVSDRILVFSSSPMSTYLELSIEEPHPRANLETLAPIKQQIMRQLFSGVDSI